MELCSYDIESESEKQSKVSDRELKMIKKKSGHNKLLFGLPIFSSIFIIIIIISLFNGGGMIPLSCIVLLLYLPATIDVLKNHKIYTCYAVVTDKETRYAKVKGRFYPDVMSYEKTEKLTDMEQKDIKYKHHFSYWVCYYYYCTVEINGHKYENICCNGKDFDKIKIGDKVIVSVNIAHTVPGIYAIE